MIFRPPPIRLRPPAMLCLVAALLVPAQPGAAAPDGYPAKIRSARTAWQKDSNRISALLEKLRSHATECNRLDREIEKARDEIRQIQEDLARQLAEMAEGRFCSQCLRGVSAIQAGGESFYTHLREVNGVEVPASPEQLEKARQSAAEKINRVRERIRQRETEKKSAAGQLSDVLHQLNVAIPEYHRDITREKDLQIAAWGDEASQWKTKLEDIQAQREALAKQPPSPARDVQARAADAQLGSSLASTTAAEARARQTATAFNQAVRHDMDGLAKKAATIPSGQPLVDGWFIGKQITSQNITYAAFPVARPKSSDATTRLLKGDRQPGASASDKSVSDLLKGK